jgi:hypothetical protein
MNLQWDNNIFLSQIIVHFEFKNEALNCYIIWNYGLCIQNWNLYKFNFNSCYLTANSTAQRPIIQSKHK